MSQYNSSMFSDAVYLFGTTFSSAPSRFDNKEELPDGTKVNRNKLAEQAVLAAFAHLYNNKLIDIVLGERKVLFRKTKTAEVKKFQSSAPDTSGLEAVIFILVQDNSNIYGLTRGLFRSNVSDPWAGVLAIVKKDLQNRGILKQVEKGKVLFITTYKNVVNEDISKEEKQVTELKKTLEELQSKGELYKIILSDIASGIYSRKVSDAGG
jgi:hypothetical protein